MGDGSKIEWTDATWNPIVGCSRVSPGCDHCYAIGVVHRGMSPQHVGLTVKDEGEPADWTGEVRVVEHLMDQPLRWRRSRRIFVNSLSDLFHPEVSRRTIYRILAAMMCAEQHTFQVLTKRPVRMRELLSDPTFRDEVHGEAVAMWPGRPGKPAPSWWTTEKPWPLPNVWWGVSIESNRYAWRADHLRYTPAAVRWISAEPLLGPLDGLDLTGIDWVVAGGESGPGARPMHPDWVRDLRDACQDRPAPCEIPDVPQPHSVPVPGGGRACACAYPDPVAFHFKQWGNWIGQADVPAAMLPGNPGHPPGGPHTIRADGTVEYPPVLGHTAIYPIAKSAAPRTLDSRTWDEYPR